MSEWLEVIALHYLLDGMGGSARDIIFGMNIDSLKDAKIAVATLTQLIDEATVYVSYDAAASEGSEEGG